MGADELIALIEEKPLRVKIRGNRQEVILSCQGLEVRFPVTECIFTQLVCSLSLAEVITKGPVEEVNQEIIDALIEAACNRKYSSFDLNFKE